MSGLDRLRGGLIVSVQAWAGSAIDRPEVLAAMAGAAEANGAVGLRAAGVENLRAIGACTTLPLIGLIKCAYPGFAPYITPTEAEVDAVLACGCAIVAVDATARPRPGGATLEALTARIHRGGALAMADCAELGDAQRAQRAGADILATTLCGYTDATRGAALPALDLVAAIAGLGAFTVCEGGIAEPAQVARSLTAGADAVVVGSAITNVDWLVRRFSQATPTRQNAPPR